MQGYERDWFVFYCINSNSCSEGVEKLAGSVQQWRKWPNRAIEALRALDLLSL